MLESSGALFSGSWCLSADPELPPSEAGRAGLDNLVSSYLCVYIYVCVYMYIYTQTGNTSEREKSKGRSSREIRVAF